MKDNDLNLAEGMHACAVAFWRQLKRPWDSEALFKCALMVLQQEMSREREEAMVRIQTDMIACYASYGKCAEAHATAKDVLARAQRLYGNRHLVLAKILKNRADLHCAQGNYWSGERDYRAALEMLDSRNPPEKDLRLQVAGSLFNLLRKTGPVSALRELEATLHY